MVRVAVFASGNGGNFESLVRKCRESDNPPCRIELFIVDKKNAFAVKRAENLGIPCYVVSLKECADKKEYEEKIIKILEDNNIELVALAGYKKIISEVLLNAYRNKIINIHPAYLPNFPGKDGIGDAFRAGASETGVTIHYVDEGVDSGEIIYQEKLIIDKSWDIEKLEEEIHKIEHRIYPMVLKQLCEKIEEERN